MIPRPAKSSDVGAVSRGAQRLTDMPTQAGAYAPPVSPAFVERGRVPRSPRISSSGARKPRNVLLGGVVDPGLRHLAEVLVGGHEADVERLGEEALPDTDRPHEQDVFVAVEKLQRAGGVEEPAVAADLCRPVEVLEPAELLEAGLAQAQLQAPVVAPAHLVGEGDLQEVGVVEPLAPDEGDALGQGVEHLRLRAFGGAFHYAR